jgi:NDP-sugar pyrophosphorylase family protein
VTGTAEIFFPDITAYHGLALRVARGELPDIAPGGWKTADGIREALDARIETRHAPGKGVEVGANAFVERHVILGDNVVLGERVYVAAATRLENVVVLPDTYVGPRLSLRDAVLAGRWIYRVDTGECARVADPRIVSRFAA